jgi:hypothetical protein
MRSRRIITLSGTSVMYLILWMVLWMVLWLCGMGMTFVEASSHADDADEFGAIQRAGNSSSSSSSRKFLSASSYSAGLCESIIQVAGYPCEEIKVTAIYI